MASAEERVGNLVEKHLGISDRAMLDADLSELGVNSVDAVNFLKTVKEEFGVDLSPEQAAGFSTMRDLIKHLS
ncbi:MAG: acyl carrier protein [Nitrospinae bacterium]|nr:acyl carrier protein [Nitrospinota bacterium]